MTKKLCYVCTRRYSHTTSPFCERCRLNKNNYVTISNYKVKKHYEDFESIISVRTNGVRGIKLNIEKLEMGNSLKLMLDDNLIKSYLLKAKKQIDKDLELIEKRNGEV